MAKPHSKPAVKRYKRQSVKDIKILNDSHESKIEPKPQPASSPKAYTMEDWQKEVAQHVPPGHPIPDWLAAKAP